MNVLQKRHNLLILLFLIFFSSLIFLWKLGDTYLTNWDEAWYSAVSREMARTGNILTPMWNKDVFFEKPPLYYWLSVPWYILLGDTSLSARVTSAIAGIFSVVLLYIIGKTIENKRVGLFSSVILLSTIGFISRARTGNFDALLAALILGSITAFYIGVNTKRKRWFILMGLLSGFAVLTKGLVGYIFPLFALFYIALVKPYRKFVSNQILGISAGIMLVCAWVLISYSVNGQAFLYSLLFHQTDKLVGSGTLLTNVSLDYIKHVKSGMKLWSLLVVPAVFYAFYAWRRTIYILIPLFASAFFFALFSVESKSNWFLLPLYPLFSLMIAVLLVAVLDKIHKYVWIAGCFIVITIALLHLVYYKSQFIAPDVAGDEARVALAANKHTKTDDVIYLTNYYVPTTVYYGDRMTYAVFSEHENTVSWWFLPRDQWSEILKKDRVFIITTTEELKLFDDYFNDYSFDTLYRSGDKLLMQKVSYE